MNQTEQRQTVSAQINRELIELLDKSTFHGLSKIFLSENILNKIFWLIASLASYGYCAFLVTNSILDFNKHEVVTKYESIYENQPLFPLVYFKYHDRNKTECIFNKVSCKSYLSYKSKNDSSEIFNAVIFNNGYPIPHLTSKGYGSGSGLQLKLRATNLLSGVQVILANHSNLILT